MSDYLINIFFDKIEDRFGKNDPTIEYVENTFIPKVLSYQKFWIEPNYDCKKLVIDKSSLKKRVLK